jgi:RNA polymerase sigma factor (sigma-70 family)
VNLPTSTPSAFAPPDFSPNVAKTMCDFPDRGCRQVMIDDSELLRRYATERSESAFSELVQRKSGLVYSAALRQVGGDRALAQDVCQSVFVDLAHKARQLADRPVLTSWLYTSTRFAALKAVRSRHRRQIREQEAQAMQDIERDALTADDWDKLRPILDSAICDLPEHDRGPILMRYFDGQPFAEMGKRLGIAENSARMRAERALEKLRSSLAQKGITSTAAALGLVIATQAVAAPPTGLATTLATAALAKSAAMGSGAGLLAKFSQFTSMNKIPSTYAAFATLGVAGVASYEAGGDTTSSAFLVYAICFGVGLLFTFFSALGGHVFGGHGEFGHDIHTGHGGHAQAHAEAGGGANDMPGFAQLSPTTIATFVTAFGGLGMIFQQLGATRSPWVSAPLAALGAFGIAAVVFVIFRALFQRTQASSEGRIADLVGQAATVITPIGPDSVGEIAYVQSGTRYSGPARTEDATGFANGAAVKIVRVVGTQFYVERC